MNKRVIISIVFFIVILIGTISIVEFYYAKDSGRMPTFSIKTTNDAKQYYKYSSLLYNVYKCYSGKVFAVSKTYKPVCNRIVVYKNDYYTNINNLKISKKDYQTIYDVSHKFDEIEKFTNYKEVEDAVLISTEFEKNQSVPIKTIQVNKEVVNIVAFKDLKANEYGDYSWEYQKSDEKYHKCEKNGLYKEYSNNQCLGEWSEIKYSDNWCKLSGNSYNLDIRKDYKKYCK